MSEHEELIREFLVESYEGLDRLDGEFVALEQDPESKETLSSIFRTIHTIKGTCGFLDLTRLERVTHAGESLLDCMREGQVGVDAMRTTALLKLVDAVREMLAHIERTGKESDHEYVDLVRVLTVLREPDPLSTKEGQETVCLLDGTLLGEVLVAKGYADEEAVERAAKEQFASNGKRLGDILVEKGVVRDDQVLDAVAAQSELAEREGDRRGGSALSGSNIRVQVEQLDVLMNLAGELVLTRNQILQSAIDAEDSNTVATAQRLNQITTELQERIMKVRMQPIGMLWSKYPRVVRDLSKQLGKEIDLKLDGKGTELDKTLLEAIGDPLTHLLRNSIDHGIEPPEERARVGKNRVGRVSFKAYHSSGQVVVEIQDDGAGIDPEGVKAKAVSTGIMTHREAADLTDRQALRLIFHAGLSTAKQVTNISGRGVGMDVVKTNIERIGGTIDVDSAVGVGTTIRIKIPLTLAIIPALIVTTAGDKYAIPQVSLVELVRLRGDGSDQRIELLHGTPVYRLRGELLPLVFLRHELGLEEEPLTDSPRGRSIVVVRAGDLEFGLVVDRIIDTEEIVVKSLDRQTKSIPVYAGTTILGDGQVALILDVPGLAQRSGVVDPSQQESGLTLSEGEQERVHQLESFLTVRGGDGHRLAIALEQVDRLEKFSASSLERTASGEVVQYRGAMMPLVRVPSHLGDAPRPSAAPEKVSVVVHSRAGRSFGLVVDGITDIVETVEPVSLPSKVPGVRRSVVIDGAVTDELDLEQLLSSTPSHGGPDTPPEDEQPPVVVGSRQYCTFYLGDLFFGVDVTQVQEVLRPQPMTRVPLANDVIRGLINLRGQTITAIDMRKRLELEVPGDDTPRPNMSLVIRSEGGVVSILVDRVGDVIDVEDTLRDQAPNTLSSPLRDLITGVYKLDAQLLLPLDIERLVQLECPENDELSAVRNQ